MSAKTFADEHQFKTFTLKDPEALKARYNNDLGISFKSVIMPTPIIINDNENPLYREILNELEGQYEDIGQRQALRALDNAVLYGGVNSIGIRYAKSFADFDINLNRQVAPDLFSDKWLVTDLFTIKISASKILSNLKEQGIIDYTKKQYGMFAGVNFKREIRFVHFKDNYEDALVYDLDKLFLSFTKFKEKDFLKLEPYEILQKSDSLSASVGGIFTAPISSGLGVKVGAMAKYERIANTDIQALGEEDDRNEGERYRVSFEKVKSATVGASASVQIEFLKLLQISLLSFDFDYELNESRKTYLSFYDKHIDDLYGDTAIADNIERLFHSKKINLDVLAPFIVSHEVRKSQNLKSKYLVLLFGGVRNQKTQHIEIVKDGIAKTFFRHNYEKTRFKQNIFSRFVSIIFKSIFKLDSLVNKKASDTKKLAIEYDSERDLMALKEDIDVTENEKLSMTMERQYYAANTVGKRDGKYKRYALKVLDNYSGVNQNIVRLFRENHLVGPVKISSKFKLGKDAIHYFHNLAPEQVYTYIKNMCGSSRFSFFNLFGSCRSRVGRTYENYLVEWTHEEVKADDYNKCKRYMNYDWSDRLKSYYFKKCTLKLAKKSNGGSLKDVPLWQFKSLSQSILDNSKTKIDLYAFFGLYNTFSYGKFEAKSIDGSPFSSYFNEGEFKGLGVVDNYMRKSKLRTPASVPIN
jgi:hypothetical protein